MKVVQYRGGMLTFSLPESWQEEQYADGGAAFFEGDGRSGTLNLRLTTVQRDDAAVQESSLREIVTTGTTPGDPPCERLPNGNYLQRYERSQTSGGELLHLTFWNVANAVPPRTVRYAVFGFAVPAQKAGSPPHEQTVRMLDERIRGVMFTTLTPEEIGAMATSTRRPWWRFW